MNIFSIIVTYILSIILGYIVYKKLFKTIPIQRLIPLLFLPIILAWVGEDIRIISFFFFKIWFSHFMIGLAAGLFLGFILPKLNRDKLKAKA